MRLTAAFFAENVEASAGAGGRFHAFGAGFDGIAVSKVPVNLPLKALLRFEVPPEEQEIPHRLEIEIKDPSGKVRERPQGIDINTIRSHLGPNEASGALVVLQIDFHFHEFGRHHIKIFVDGIERGEMSIYVKQHTASSEAE